MITRIRSKEEIARANRRRQLIIGGAMILLLVVSTAGFALLSGSHEGDNSNQREENGFTFYRGQGGWIARVNDVDFGFRYLPSQLANVSVVGSFDLATYTPDTVLYFTESNQGTNEVMSNLGRFVLRYQEACLNGSASCGDVPIKTCSDNVFVWLPSNHTKVYKRSNCVYLEGDQTKAADAFLYKLLKIT